MAQTLASTLNQPMNPNFLAGQVQRMESEPNIQKRGQAAFGLEPFARQEQSRLTESAALEEARLQRAQIDEEKRVAEESLGRQERLIEEERGKIGDRPERTITAFNPDRAIELATLTALMGVFAGSVTGQAALKAMEGVSEGYRKGQQDLYEREVSAYNDALSEYKSKIDQAEQIIKRRLELETQQRGLGEIEAKKLTPLLNDGLIVQKNRIQDINGQLESIKEAKKLYDQLRVKAFEAGLKPREIKAQQILDPNDPGKAILVDINRYSGLGRNDKAFIGDAVPSAKATTKTAKQEAADETRAEGARKFNILTGQLRNTYTRLQESGEIRDVTQPALQNMFVYLKTTGVGQEIQRMLGYSPQDLRDYTGGLRASLMNAIREATGLGSRSLDSNKELEFYLQAVTDPSATIQSNMRALQDLEAIYGNLKSIADAEGLDDDRVVERAIQAFGAHEPQKYRYSITANNKLERTPRAAAPAQQQGTSTDQFATLRKQAQDAIAAGRDEAQVRARFKERTGEDL